MSKKTKETTVDHPTSWTDMHSAVLRDYCQKLQPDSAFEVVCDIPAETFIMDELSENDAHTMTVIGVDVDVVWISEGRYQVSLRENPIGFRTVPRSVAMRAMATADASAIQFRTVPRKEVDFDSLEPENNGPGGQWPTFPSEGTSYAVGALGVDWEAEMARYTKAQLSNLLPSAHRDGWRRMTKNRMIKIIRSRKIDMQLLGVES